MSSTTDTAGRAQPSAPATPGNSQVYPGIPLSTKFHALLAILIASTALNNPGNGHAILTDATYVSETRLDDDYLYRRPTLFGVLNALATIFVRYAEVVATTAIDSAENVAADILTMVQVEAEGLESLEEMELESMADFVLVQNSEEDHYFDKGSTDHCVLVPHGNPFQLEHGKRFDLLWWTNLIEQT